MYVLACLPKAKKRHATQHKRENNTKQQAYISRCQWWLLAPWTVTLGFGTQQRATLSEQSMLSQVGVLMAYIKRTPFTSENSANTKPIIDDDGDALCSGDLGDSVQPGWESDCIEQ